MAKDRFILRDEETGRLFELKFQPGIIYHQSSDQLATCQQCGSKTLQNR